MSKDDKVPIGRRIQKPKAKSTQKVNEDASISSQSATEITSGTQESTIESGRPDDTTLGRRIQKPSATTSTQTKPSPEIDWSEETDDAETAVFSAPLKIPSLLNSTSFLFVLLLGISVLLLFVYAHIASTLSSLFQLPTFLMIPGVVGLSCILLLLLYAVWQLISVLRTLKVNRQISIMKVRMGTNTKPAVSQSAKRVLSEYTLRYQAETVEEIFHDIKGKEFVRSVEQSRRELLAEKPRNSADWITDFEQSFIHTLDNFANERIHFYAKAVAFKTGISPNGLLDTAIVLYNNFRLLRELCVIYQVRTGRLGTMYLLLLSIFHSYIAAHLGDQLDNLSDDVAQAMGEATGTVGSNILGKIAGKFATKATEATAHYFFTRRIGAKARDLLRPIA